MGLAALLALTVSASAPCEERRYATGARSRLAVPPPGVALARSALSPLERQFVDDHPVLRVAIYAGSYPPYQHVDPDGEPGGYAIDLLRALAGTTGFELVPIVFDTWPETLAALRDRRADLLPITGYTSDRDGYLDYTRGVFPDPIGLLGRVGDDRFEADERLDGVRVAVVRGFVTESQLPVLYPGAVPVPVDSLSEGLAALGRGRADLFFGGAIPAMTLAADAAPDSPQDMALEVVRLVRHGTGWNHIAVRSDWSLVARMFERFLDSGPGRVLEDSLAELGAIAPGEFQPLAMTASEAALLGRYDRLRLGALNDLPLLNGVTDRGTHTGVAAGFSAYLSYEFGLPLEVVSYATTADMLDAAERGEIDLVPLLVPSERRRRRFAFSTPYLTSPWLVVGRGGAAPLGDPGDLAGLRLGLWAGTPLRERLLRLHPDIDIVERATPRGLMRALANGEIDAAAMERQVALPLINQDFAGELRALGRLDGVEEAGFAFAAPPASAALVPLIDRALEQMNPALSERIVQRWGAVDFEPAARLRRMLTVLVPAMLGLLTLSMAVVVRNRRIAAENRRRVLAERRLVDMTDGLRTGVFQVLQRAPDTLRFVFVNAMARRMARLSDTSHEGEVREILMQYVHPEDRSRVEARMAESLLSGKPFREAFRFAFAWDPDGWVLAEATGRDDAKGSRIWSGYLFDLTGERRLNEQLNAQLVAREEFVATAGHEMRTPVQRVSLALEALGLPGTDEARDARLDAARQATDDLRDLVGDLLDIGQLDARELNLREVPMRLHDLVDSVAHTLRASATDKGLALECRVAAGVPDDVEADPVRLRQLLYNLLGNAIKYTDRGAITLEVFPADCDAADYHPDIVLPAGTGDAVGFAVRDSGIGIAEEHQATIFEPFSTVGPTSRGSTGLGLAICSRLVAVMGGRMKVESAPGIGSAFLVCLPLKRPAAMPDRTPRALPASTATVLLVDDDAFVRVTLASLLRGDGFDVDEVGSAHEALERLEQRRYEAVVTDYRMPGMTGLELARAIRRRAPERESRPALIGMTGGMPRETTGRAGGVFDALLIKPVNTVQIRHAIEANRGPGASARVVAAASPSAGRAAPLERPTEA